MNKGFDKETFKRSVVDNVKNMFRRTIDEATPQQVFQAVAYAVKDVIIDEWIATHKEYEKKDVKTVYYPVSYTHLPLRSAGRGRRPRLNSAARCALRTRAE